MALGVGGVGNRIESFAELRCVGCEAGGVAYSALSNRPVLFQQSRTVKQTESKARANSERAQRSCDTNTSLRTVRDGNTDRYKGKKQIRKGKLQFPARI